MSRTFHDARHARLVALVVGLLLAALTVLATASPAHAHDELLGSDPAAKSTVDALPAQLRLTFSGVIATEERASEVQVTDASGVTLTDGAPTAQDNVLTQPLAGEASGTVTVLWKVVSSDGHPISGEFSFTVAGAPAPTAEPDEPAPTRTATPTPTLIDDMTDDPVETPLVGLIPVLLAAGVAAVVIALVVSARRRRSGPSGPGSEPPADQ
ncbi:copper resistance CopC family protein [Microbacterium sp. CPCC 204701]|uniref:copper resistance CopC family protein n=1 Tax=Microbacterium sp. CPCC 204701 TaxID=2493084 RepID=UPI000FD93D98|nr:copper resistance CopC family protein [Microbacterium sp. CPCC 204701]